MPSLTRPLVAPWPPPPRPLWLPAAAAIDDANPNLLSNPSFEGNSAAGWSAVSATINPTTAQVFAGSYAGLLQAQAATAEHYCVNSIGAAVAGQVYKAAIAAKAGSVSWINFGDSGDTQHHNAWFDLSVGAVGSTRGALLSAQVASLGGGWWRLVVTFSWLQTGNAPRIHAELATGNSVASFAAAGTETLYIDDAYLGLA